MTQPPPFSLPDAIAAAGGDTAVGAMVGKHASTVCRWRLRHSYPSPEDQPGLARALGVKLPVLSAWCATAAAESAATRAAAPSTKEW